ncbi:hypothetical protein LCM19_11580 [Qipengyuania flava]|nr:hypothetical protein [Qipengyuania flava]
MPMRNALPSRQQRARRTSFGDFYYRTPAHARERPVWLRFLHLSRQIYGSPFSALVALGSGGPQVLDWVDNRLDGAFSDYVEKLETEVSLAPPARPLHPLNSIMISGDWICVRLSYFGSRAPIGIAVFIEDAANSLLDTASLHSLEKVLTAFLRSRLPHEDPKAPSSWPHELSGHATAPAQFTGANTTKRG